MLGIYGNSKQEAMYPIYTVDSNGQPLDGSKSYTLRFAPGQLPPANAFWSLTMYELPSSLLVANPINRYLLNSPMLPQFKRDADGGLTFYIQNESPGADKEANWLPAPKGPFMAVDAPLLAQARGARWQMEAAADVGVEVATRVRSATHQFEDEFAVWRSNRGGPGHRCCCRRGACRPCCRCL